MRRLGAWQRRRRDTQQRVVSLQRRAAELEKLQTTSNSLARVVGEPVWNGRINLRGLERLIVDVAG